ncbi:MAG: lysophospholipid acyltransferase family protein [bacterium]
MPSGDKKDHSTIPGLEFQWRMVGPKYWGTWILLGVLWLLMFVPRSWVMNLGAWVGDQFRKRNHKRRRIAEINIALCFPDLSQRQQEQLCIEHFRSHGRGLVDMGLSLWGSERRLRKLVSLEGFETHQNLVKSKNVLVVTWHLTTLEISANVLTLAGDSVSMMKPLSNSLLTWQIARGRRHLHAGDPILVTRNEGLRPLLRGLRDGRQCILLPDEDLAGEQIDHVFVPFFGVPRANLTTPVRLAKSAKAVVVTCATRLIPETGRYVFTVSPPLQDLDGKDVEKDAIAISRSMEELIKQAPEQYMWTFRWFRTRPDGEPDPYDPVPGK